MRAQAATLLGVTAVVAATFIGLGHRWGAVALAAAGVSLLAVGLTWSVLGAAPATMTEDDHADS